MEIIVYTPLTPVLVGPEPPNQTGKKVTFWSQIVQRMQQLLLWIPWVMKGNIHPFPTPVNFFRGL